MVIAMDNNFINKGQKPFELNKEALKELSPKDKKKKARELNKKHYGLKGMGRKKKPPCPECGRRIGCKHSPKAEGYIQPKLMIEWITCTNCKQPARKEASYCPSCGLYDPSKPRGSDQPEPETKREEKKRIAKEKKEKIKDDNKEKSSRTKRRTE